MNVVIPLHTRGMITLSGKTSTDCGSCCETKKANKSKDAPTEKDRQQCAVCNVAATYIPVEVYVMMFDRLYLLELLPETVDRLVNVSPCILTYDACGPPAIG